MLFSEGKQRSSRSGERGGLGRVERRNDAVEMYFMREELPKRKKKNRLQFPYYPNLSLKPVKPVINGQ